MNKKRGRKITITDINVDDLENWIKESNAKWCVIKCQSLIALGKGVNVNEICKVLCITRESLRIWRNIYNQNGITGLLANKNKGKKSFFNQQIETDLMKVLILSPKFQGYETNMWDGKMVCLYLKDKWNIEISVRTAQAWMKKIGIRQEKRKRISFE